MVFVAVASVPSARPLQPEPFYPPKKCPWEVRGYQEPSGARHRQDSTKRQESPPGPDRQDRTSITVSNGFFLLLLLFAQFATCTVYLSLSAMRDSHVIMQGIVRLTEKVLELETRIQTLVEDSKNVRAVDTALDVTSSGTPVHCSVPALAPVQQGNWVTVRQHSRGSKHRSSVPIRTSNRFSPLSDAPTEKPGESALVIGDSIVRNVKNRDTSHHSPLFTGSQSA